MPLIPIARPICTVLGVLRALVFFRVPPFPRSAFRVPLFLPPPKLPFPYIPNPCYTKNRDAEGASLRVSRPTTTHTRFHP
jgi:hypothetical protein